MVSIPDWSKFRGLGEANAAGSVAPPHNYYRQREQEAIREAEENGYFTSATETFLQERFLQKNSGRPSRATRKSRKGEEVRVDNIRLLKLPHARLRGLGDIGMCANLQICILGNNYICRFDGLAACTQLVRLDLHSNQIGSLPGPLFWSNMSSLRILNLHDNPVGGIDNLHSLSSCSALIALTLYDTPLSLKPNYRHHVVNSIWALKALDHHVISDEEIIEDAEFGGRFAALMPDFRINLCPQAPSDEEETDTIRDVIQRINCIQAHTSPVLILQRYLRGHLKRKRYKLVRDMRIWAAVTIQREYRDWKGLPTPRTQVPPPPSPVAEYKSTKMHLGIPSEASGLDYDTYLRNRRPGSGRSDTSEHKLPGTPVEEPDAVAMVEDVNKKKNLYINLAKLHQGSIYSGEEILLQPANTVQSSEKPIQHSRQVHKVAPTKKKKEEPTFRRVKSIRHFFGPVVELSQTPEPEFLDNSTVSEEIPLINFRLRGRRENVVYYDATTEMLIARREAGQEVRAAEDHFHGQQMAYKPTPIRRTPNTNNRDRMFARVQGTMGMTCLQAIQQAYRDRERAERKTKKVDAVLNMREDRELARERVKMYQEDRRIKVIQQRDAEQRRLLDAIERHERHQQASVNRYKDTRKLSSHLQRHRTEERTFIMDFNVQNTSVSNALLRHDRQARVEDQHHRRTETIANLRDYETEQQEVVRKYMEHRQLMRQTESAMSRAAVDTKMLQEANDRLIEAKHRVDQQKTRSENIQTYYPLPCVSNQSLAEQNASKFGILSKLDADGY